MADGPPSSSSSSSSSTTTSITDLNADSLAHCASYLTLQDISNLAICCKHLKQAAYSDSIWLRLLRDRWPRSFEELRSGSLQLPALGMREAYLAMCKALKQFKFGDPIVGNIITHPEPFENMLLKNNFLYYSQGPSIKLVNIDEYLTARDSQILQFQHNARVTCIRSFDLNDVPFFRSSRQDENVLISSSCDHTIRLWWKGRLQRGFRGHNGPVPTLSDKLLGDATAGLLSSGGEDGTVRLWSLNLSGNRGQQALKATLYGHGKPIKLMTVAGHKTSLLVTIATDSKVRVWDTSTSSSIRSSCCVGMTSVAGTPVAMRCQESLLYVAAGTSVVAIDLRTMQKVTTVAICRPRLYSTVVLASKSLICTGGDGKAMLWDTRRNQETLKPEPVAELDGHSGRVTQLHMDLDKIVTGGPEDYYVYIWDTDTGVQTNSLRCSPEDSNIFAGCSALAVNGYRIVTGIHSGEHGILQCRDFTNAASPVSNNEVEPVSKFWDRTSEADSDYSDYTDDPDDH